jgi:hypothetical protein
MGNTESGEIVHRETDEVALLVKSGLAEERRIGLAQGASLEAVVEFIARERGLPIEELVIVREGEDEPLALELVIMPEYPHRRRHHVHYRGMVKVVVFYGGKEKEREFKRHATVEDVLVWAIKVFEIDPAMAAEFELARQGQKEELPGAEHIGHVAGKAKELKLDLVRGDISNG